MLFKIILPMILSQLLAVAVGTIDSIMVAWAGEDAVSGVSLVGTLDVLLVLFFTSLVTGGAVIVAQALGRNDKGAVSESAKQLIYVTTAIATVLSAIVLIVRVPMLNLFFGNASDSIMKNAQDYFFFIALSFPFLAIESSVASLFRAAGNSITPLIVSIGLNVLNIILNATFILGFGMGAAGAAIATLIARGAGALVMFILINNKQSTIYVDRIFRYKPDFKIIKEVLHIGVPNGIENGMFQFGRLVTQSLVSSLGSISIAANAVALTICNFQYTVGTAYSNSMITVVGRCVGAEKPRQAKRYSGIILTLNYLTLWLIIIVTVIFISPIMGVYKLSEEATRLAIRLVLFHCVFASIMWPMGFTLPSAFRAAKDVKFPMYVSMFSMWIFRVAGAYVLALESVSVFGLFEISGFGMGIMGVWLAMIIDWVFRTTLYVIRYISGRWLKAKR